MSHEGTAPPPATLVSVIPNLRSRAGHHWDYNLSVGRAAQAVGLAHEAAIPVQCDWEGIPDNWQRCLSWQRNTAATGAARSVDTAVQAGRLAWSLARWLWRRPSPRAHGDEILFLEDFLPIQLAALALAVLVAGRGRRAVWVLYRYNSAWVRGNLWWHRLCLKLLDIATGGATEILSDSERIAQSLGPMLSRSVHVVPIPHTTAPMARAAPGADGSAIRCWWPGAPRPPKGSAILAELVRRTEPQAGQFVVVAARSAALASVPGGVRVVSIDDALSRDAYLAEFARSDIVLLPYDAEMYAESTSGIFVEAVIFGTVPVVTPHTWMARELEKFDLGELAIDWHGPELIARLRKLVGDTGVRTKLHRLREQYLAYHSEAGYADVIRLLRAPRETAAQIV